MKRIKQVLASMIAVVSMMLPMAIPAVVHAAPVTSKEQLCKGVEFDENATTCTTGEKKSVTVLLKSIVQWLIIIIGSISVIMIIFGGFKYITSGGDSNSITSAKNTILYAIIGLVIVLFAQSIVTFVLTKLE